MTRPTNPGLHPDVAFEDYLSWDAVSSHDLMLVDKSPAHYAAAKERPSKPTDAMRFGTAAHAWILQPDEAPDLVMVAPKVDRRTKAGKAAWAEFEAESHGRTIVSEEEARTLAMMAGAIQDSPAARTLLQRAKIREASALWQIGETWCRARPDALDPNGLIVDLKTSQDASPDAFARTAATFKYHLQAAWYIDGLHAAGVTPEQTAFAFVVIEKTPPHSVGTYVLDAESLDLGREMYTEALSKYTDAREMGVWGGYTSSYRVETLSLPRWAFKRND
jgi:hypothetical protein